jgi:ketosteroid isomerase-like protein
VKSMANYGMLAVVAFIFATSASAANSKYGAEKAAVDKAVHEIVAAYGEGPASLEKYFSYYADDMTILKGTGRWTKQDYYNLWKDLNNKGGGVTTAEIQDLTIQVLSPTVAVTTYMMPVTVRYPNNVVPEGKPATIMWEISDTWAKQADGRWVVKSLTYMQQTRPKAN